MASAPRFLLTGATGFVGSRLRGAIATRWPQATIVALSAGEPSPGVAIVDLLDRADLDAAVAAARPDVVIHLAAQASVARGGAESAATWAVNLGGSLNLANAVAGHAPNAIVLFASSSEVYGASFLGGRVDEASPLLPMNAYAKSKALAERTFAEVLAPGTRLIVARPFNHTGPGQAPTFVLPSFAQQVARIEAGRQPPRLEVGNLDVAREFLDVRDVVDAYIKLIEAAPRLPPRFTCNIASGDARPLRQRVETLRGLARVAFDIVVDPARLRPIDLPVAAGEAALLRATTGWAPRFDMDTTLADLLAAARADVQRGIGPPPPACLRTIQSRPRHTGRHFVAARHGAARQLRSREGQAALHGGDVSDRLAEGDQDANAILLERAEARANRR